MTKKQQRAIEDKIWNILGIAVTLGMIYGFLDRVTIFFEVLGW